MSEKLTTAALMAKYLSQAGIGYVFGYPGDPNERRTVGIRVPDLDVALESNSEAIERTSCD